MTEAFFKQTAEDYGVDREIVEKIYCKTENSIEFYNELERMLKERNK